MDLSSSMKCVALVFHLKYVDTLLKFSDNNPQSVFDSSVWFETVSVHWTKFARVL